MWQQAVEMVQQSGADSREYTALVDEEWQYKQYRELFRKRAHKALSMDLEPGSLIGTDTKAVKLQQPARMRKVVACFREFCF